MSNNFIELAWCAGFLDGEGYFQSYRQTSKVVKMRYRICATQVARFPLDRLQAALGGKVRGPYGPYSGNRQAHYQWIVEGDEARSATDILMPYLCPVKIEQARKALEATA